MNIVKLNSVIFFLIGLGVTLRSFYIYSISLAPLPLISIFLVFFLCYLNRQRLRTAKLDSNIVLFIAFFIMYICFSISLNFYYRNANINVNSIFGVFLNLSFFFSIYLLKDVFVECKKGLNYLIIFHLCFFFFQFFMFHVFGDKIDYLLSITGEAQRFNGFANVEGSGTSMFRPVGLFTEPGNYSIHILTLLWLAYLADEINPIVEKCALASVVLSFSLTGMAGVLVYIVLKLNKKIELKYMIISILSLIAFAYIFNELIINYLSERVGNISNDNSTNVRVMAFEAITSFSITMQLFGVGLGHDYVQIHLPTIPYVLVTFGIVGSIIIFLLFITLAHSNNVTIKTYLFFLFISFQFYTLMHPLFWYFWVGVFIFSSHAKRKACC
ncbi:hypothetical protein [Colwellia psychrerythraea]|uniref:Putative membrane protein n=1 Tax=Colwellia psychrerythraea (strain 34H / ATCC BAA-681) TaxID=167879 RepID=Q489C9_COLP3|nr:hypothetical protein [Colwellia psychrerythraea]AAZ26806.1 putative membrane protein [Colwellia psychrerythraea 34H]